MRFRRIAVRNFRKLIAPVVIDTLTDGVTIIAGDNEEGKSTLLDAIRAGLFERHNLGGKALEAMQPFGSSVRPEICLDFDIDGQNYSIIKGFAQKPYARLTTPKGVFEGMAAEERLAELLTFRVPQRGESKKDDQGVLGLFWLEQGAGLHGLSLGETGRSTLRSSLEEEVGDVLGGSRGRRLLDAAKARRDALVTGKGKARGELAAAIEAAAKAAARVAELQARRRDYDEEIDQLDRTRRELDRIRADRELERAQEALAAAEKNAKLIEVCRQRDIEAGQAVALAKVQSRNAADRWARRQALIDAVAARVKARTEAEVHLAQVAKEADAIEERVRAANTVLTEAVEKRTAAEARVMLAHTHARIEALDREIADLDRRLREVKKLQAAQKSAKARLAAIKIDAEAFDRLQSLQAKMREARAGLGAVATRVRFLPSHHQAVLAGGEAVALQDAIEVTEATTFTLEGFGQIEIKPGALDINERRLRFKRAEKDFASALAAAGVKTLEEAKASLALCQAAEAEINETKRMIAALAPDGIDALHSIHAERCKERDEHGEHTQPCLADAVDDLETETRARDAARITEEEARIVAEKARSDRNEHVTRVAVAKEKLKAAKEAEVMAEKELASAREEISDDALASALTQAQAGVIEAERQKADTEAALGALKPEETELRRKQAEAAVKAIETEQRQLREKLIALESRLTALGRSGIGEQLDEALGIERQTIAHRDRLQTDAEAWGLLVETLSDAERAAKEAFLEPVLKRVDPFLRLLMPEARITLDEETLEIKGVTRSGHDEPYVSLSVGTREQLSVLVRLAFAVYLQEKGVPAAVILDDALVYTDDGRFERMQLALRKAAETIQILILTCRPRDWRQFGAPIKRLADGQVQASAAA